MAFQKGVSGNPSGRPAIPKEVLEMARAHTVTAIDALVRIVTSTESPAAAVVSASVAILDRAWGKPLQPNEHTGAEGAALFPVLEVIRTAREPRQSVDGNGERG